MKEKLTVCFIGHRKIKDTPELRERLRDILQELVENGTVDFLFGDHSAFDDLCYETVTALKEKYPAIRRIHFRCDYEDADAYTMRFLISGYEESICPRGVSGAGRARYAERNRAMIQKAIFAFFIMMKPTDPPAAVIRPAARRSPMPMPCKRANKYITSCNGVTHLPLVHFTSP